jgi:hypothetical protein
MQIFAAAPAIVLAAVLSVLGGLAAPALAESTNVPTNAYYDRALTADEKDAIQQEEAVTPNDGQASVPPPGEEGIIPDAAVPGSKSSEAKPHQKPQTEAEVIIEDSKKVAPVTKKDFDECMQTWSPQTQMTKTEWAASCRTTLGYFPEKD